MRGSSCAEVLPALGDGLTSTRGHCRSHSHVHPMQLAIHKQWIALLSVAVTSCPCMTWSVCGVSYATLSWCSFTSKVMLLGCLSVENANPLSVLQMRSPCHYAKTWSSKSEIALSVDCQHPLLWSCSAYAPWCAFAGWSSNS